MSDKCRQVNRANILECDMVWAINGRRWIGHTKCFLRRFWICVEDGSSVLVKVKASSPQAGTHMHTSSPKVTWGQPGLSALNVRCFLLFLGRFPSGLHSAVWNQGHLDVVCAPPLQGEPHPGPSGHWGSGWCGEGKAGNLLYSWHSTYNSISHLNSTFATYFFKLQIQL